MRTEEAYELDREYYESKMKEINKNENQKTICEWASQVFGDKANNINVYKEKLKEEIEEFLLSQNPDELADIYIVIVQLANILNSDLQTLVNDKMKINRERKWNFNGKVFKHIIKDEEKKTLGRNK